MSPSPASATTGTTPWIPEVMTRIGAYLTPPDLLSAVCVSQHWNQTYIPLLWHHIDDSLYSWPTLVTRISPTLDADSEEREQEETDRIRKTFEKYGCHIRKLFLSRRELLAIVSAVAMAAGTGEGESPCTSLQDLHVSLINIISPKEQAENDRIKALTMEEWVAEIEQARAKGMPAVLSPVLEGVFEVWTGPFQKFATQVKDWETTQHFWLLVRQNREGMRSLKMTWSIMGSCRIAKYKFLYDTLGGMKQLRVLKNEMVMLDLDRVMISMPMLEEYSTSRYLMGFRGTIEDGDRSGKAPSMNLKVLEIRGPMESGRVNELLKRFVDLHRLSIGQLYTDSTIAIRPRPLTGGGEVSMQGSAATAEQSCFKSRLKVLEIDRPRPTGPTVNILLGVLRLVPHLTGLSVRELDMETAIAIGRGCESLETFSLWIKVIPNPANQEQPGTIELNALNVILQSCSRLRRVDASRCMISAENLLEHRPAWVCQNLELLRCQMVGFYCLTDEEQEAIQTIKGPDFVGCEESDYERQALLYAYRRQEQHKAVYGRIAGLKRLVTLDLGSGYRERALPGLRQQPETVSARREDALEVSLLMRLDQLSTLGSLEEFGFEGLDVGFGEDELEWMVRSWPRLKVVRGLQERVLDNIETRQRKARLRQSLRVKKASVAQK